MNKTEYIEKELRITMKRSGENAMRMREALDDANAKLAEAKTQNDVNDAAMVELAGMLDTALTCVNEQNAALVELADLIAEGSVE